MRASAPITSGGDASKKKQTGGHPMSRQSQFINNFRLLEGALLHGGPKREQARHR